MKTFVLLVLLTLFLAGCDNSYNATALTIRTAGLTCEPNTFKNQFVDDGNMITITITCKKLNK